MAAAVLLSTYAGVAKARKERSGCATAAVVGRGHPAFGRGLAGGNVARLDHALDTATRVSKTKRSAWLAFTARTRGGIAFTGLLCTAKTAWHGSLYVLEVDGVGAPQFVRGMPHLEYLYAARDPADPLPPRLREARVALKLDGTNISFFPLRGRDGHILEVVAKTRRAPVVTDTPFGAFRTMLDELDPYARTDAAVRDCGHPLAFELWGRRNLHLVRYGDDLRLSLHTGIAGNHLTTPARLDLLARHHGLVRAPEILSVPCSALDARRLAAIHAELRERFESQNRAAGRHTFVVEGAIVALATANTAEYFKLKPPTLEALHGTLGGLARSERLTPIAVRQILLSLDGSGYDFARLGLTGLLEELVDEFGEAPVHSARSEIEREYALFAEELAVRVSVFERLAALAAPLPSEAALVEDLAPHYAPRHQATVLRAVERYLATAQPPLA